MAGRALLAGYNRDMRCAMYPENYTYISRFVMLCYLLVCPYLSALLLRYWDNDMITPVPVKQSWREWVNKSHAPTTNNEITRTKETEKGRRFLHIFWRVVAMLWWTVIHIKPSCAIGHISHDWDMCVLSYHWLAVVNKVWCLFYYMYIKYAHHRIQHHQLWELSYHKIMVYLTDVVSFNVWWLRFCLAWCWRTSWYNKKTLHPIINTYTYEINA